MHPVLFRIGASLVPSFSFMVSIGFLMGGLLFVVRGGRRGISIGRLVGLVVAGQVAGLVGARLLYAANVGAQTAAPYNFSFSAGNTQQAVAGVASGWTATVTNNSISSGSTNSCQVQVGAGAVSTLDGTIRCP